jgi:hypothetical protein
MKSCSRILFALLALVPLGTAQAATVRLSVLTFAPLSGDLPQGAGDRAADLLASELKSIGELELAPRVKVVGNPAADAVAAARKKLGEARAALAQKNPVKAEAAYRAALAGFHKGLPAAESFQEAIEGQAELGALLYRRGNDEEGYATLLDAMRLSVGHPLRIVEQSPTFTANAEAMTKKVASLPKGSVRVESTPAGADVFVDGQIAGKAPVLVKALPEGKHYFNAVLPSGERWGTTTEVLGGGKVTRLRAQSGAEGPGAELNSQLAENRIDPQALLAAKAAAKASNSSLIVFGALHRLIDGLALDAFLYNVAKDKLLRLKRVEFDSEMIDAGVQMDKLVAEIQQRLSTPGTELHLPARVADDLAADRGLASDYVFGGPPPEISPIEAPPPVTSEGTSTRKVIVKKAAGSDAGKK